MSTDPDIQFGDLEEEQPDIELRPDRNAHYAVVAYGEPVEGELPIFVDLDVLIEMESHARTDTSVELGGIMLGGQLHDDEGRPYVLVQDSVRAQHYEATKGSFKFTHDTWQQITRERDEFPSGWDMVGWYHTHPDWGVFLSGMDMFICDNFFNKPLDVALVIDPCRQDRGFFQWTGDPRERKRRVGGFYVIASRHRQAELEQFVAELEGGYTMRTDPNMRAGYNVSPGSGGPTIVNITEQRPGWLGQAVVATMVFQAIVLLLFGYIAFAPRVPAEGTASSSRDKLTKEEQLEVKTEVLDEVIASMSGGEKDVVSRLQDREEQIRRLENDLAVVKLGVPEMVEDTKRLEKERNDLESKYENYKEKYFKEQDRAFAWKTKYEKLADLEGEAEESQEEPWYAPLITWQGITVSVVVLLGLALATVVALRGQVAHEMYPEDEYGQLPPDDAHGQQYSDAEAEPKDSGEPGDGGDEEPPLR